MKKWIALLLFALLLLALLVACSGLGAAPTATPTFAFRRTGGAGGAGGAGGNFATRTPTETETPQPTATATAIPTLTSTVTPTPTDTIAPTNTGLPFSAYDSRLTITNRTSSPIEYTFIGPAESAIQVQLYLYVSVGQTGFLLAPHGTYRTTVVTGGVTTVETYHLKVGSWSCQLPTEGCMAFK